MRKAPWRKKQGLRQTGRRASILDMSFEGFVSPDKGRLEMASNLSKSSSAKSFSKCLFKVLYGSSEGGDLMRSRTWFAVSRLKDDTQ